MSWRLAARTSVLLLAIAVGEVRAARAADGYVERRGGAPRLVGDVLTVDDAGVHMQAAGERVIVAWDRVRRIGSDRPLSNLTEHLAFGESLWRARSRVERGDEALAEPLLERLFEVTRGTTHETALVVAEGLLRCRVARGAHEEAVVPALEVLRLRRDGVTTTSYASLMPALDADTGLCPVLAPFFAAPRRAGRLARELEAYDEGEDDRVIAYAALYAAAARLASDGEIGTESETPMPEGDATASWFGDLIAAQDAVPSTRRAARQRLRRTLAAPVGSTGRSPPMTDGTPRTWTRAWTLFALGTSQRLETGLDERELGILDLLRIPARYASDQPYLSGLAMAHASVGLRDANDDNGAQSLADELAQRWPSHPARIALTAMPETRPQ